MIRFGLTGLLAILGCTRATNHALPGVEAACNELATLFPSDVLFPDSAKYKEESTNYWDIRASLKPACIILPTGASGVSQTVSVLVSNAAQFAIRGGGHMNVCSVAMLSFRYTKLRRRDSSLVQITSMAVYFSR